VITSRLPHLFSGLTGLAALLSLAAVAPLTAQTIQTAQTTSKGHAVRPSPSHSHSLNTLVLEQINTMPRGGTYSTTAEASARLRRSISVDGGSLAIEPRTATPSYCSGATYLVFLKTLDALSRQGGLHLSPETLAALAVRGQPDGTGVWGRWNANGPGTARLFHELKLGRNFDKISEARPGDFMKIFWTTEVGSRERGHSVIFLGADDKEIRFWSSNTPDGYGVKSVPVSKVAYALFSRLETPERINDAPALPRSDSYLASLLSKRSSAAEARAKSGVR